MKYPLYNNTLCPRVWDKTIGEYEMKPEIRKELLTIATDFIDRDIKENNLPLTVVDVILIGSLTNFNWTKYSDFDVHIVVELNDLDMSSEDAQLLVDGLKGIWNKNHSITIKGHPVELYVQDSSAKPYSLSAYSIKNGDWIKEPTKDKPEFDKEFIKNKHEKIKSRLDLLFKNPTEKKLEDELEKIYSMRQSGLDSGGEFSSENLVFKILRAQGYLDKLKELINKTYDSEHSIDEVESITDGLKVDDKDDLIVTKDSHDELIPTDDRFGNHVWKFAGHKIFGAYRIDPLTVKSMKTSGKIEGLPQELTRLRHALKHPTNEENAKIIKKLIDNSLDLLFRKFSMESVHIIMPLGSKSGLNKIIANEIDSRLPNTILLDTMHKAKWKDVQLSPIWKHEVEQSDGIPMEGTRRAKQILSVKHELHADEDFQIKQVPRGLRRYYSDFYRTKTGETIDLASTINNATVLLIDDTMEEGATMREAYRVLEQFNPKEILSYVFLYGVGAGV